MRTIAIVGFVAVLGIAAAVRAAQEPPAMPKPQKEHEWLQQIVGEWDTEGEIPTEPGKPPMKTKGSESSRMIGGFWAILENKGEFMGAPFTGILSLGFDPGKKKYVGTWLDSFSSILWHYQGSVDATGRILTLETEGPDQEQPGKTARYKEVLEIKDKDRKVFTSMREKDGQWLTFITITYSRKK